MTAINNGRISKCICRYQRDKLNAWLTGSRNGA